MANIVKTFTENEGGLGHRATWTITLKTVAQKVYGDFAFAMPELDVKYVCSGKTRGAVNIDIDFNVGGVEVPVSYMKMASAPIGQSHTVPMASGATYTIEPYSYKPEIDVSQIFNESNKEVDVAPITAKLRYIYLESAGNNDANSRQYVNYNEINLGEVGRIDLIAPPEVISCDYISVGPYYPGYSSLILDVDVDAKYGTDVGEMLIVFDGDKGVLSDVFLPDSSGIAEVYMKPWMHGLYKYPYIQITDLRGQWVNYNLPSIQVDAYDSPLLHGLDIERCDENRNVDDEGTFALIQFQYEIHENAQYVNRPAVLQNIAIDVSNEITWYDSQGTQVSFPYEYSSGTLYGQLANVNVNETYDFSVTINDDIGGSATSRDTLSQAFYTMDVKAGGHGIAFGAPAINDEFFVNMKARFSKTVGVGNISDLAAWIESCINTLNDLTTPKDEEITVTASVGQLVDVAAKRLGNMLLVTYAVKNPSAISAGGNLFVGKQSNLLPPFLINGIGYVGSTACVLQMVKNGDVVVRATGAGVNANTTVYINACYILNNE